MGTYLKQFIECHEGVVNKLIHIGGFILIGWGIINRNAWLVILGGLFQELGHVYQYGKTHNFKYSPRYCFKPQLIFAYPLFGLVILYILAVN